MVSLFTQYSKALSSFGLKGTLTQLYTFGHIKFGNRVGEDKFGNEYYENNLDYPIGQNRWVVYKDMHNPCASMVPPSWHSWLHSMTDVRGIDAQAPYKVQQTGVGSSAAGKWDDHVGGGNDVKHEMNQTGFRSRGYGVGSIYADWGTDTTFIAPGNALKKAVDGDYKPNKKEVEAWTPDGSEDVPKDTRLRSLDKI